MGEKPQEALKLQFEADMGNPGAAIDEHWQVPKRGRATFGDMALDFDSLFEDVDDLSRREALSLDATLRPRGVRTILDCACGTGIQSIGLAELGYQMSASDLSRKALALLQEKARLKHLLLETKCADFRTLKPWQGRSFDAVISCGNSLTLVPLVEDVKRALTSMIRVTKIPGGLGVVGLHNYLRLRREGETLFFRRLRVCSGSPEWVFDLRFFGSERVQVTHAFLRLVRGRWRLRTYTKSYLYLSAEALREIMLSAGYCSVRLLDVCGQREFNDDEWLLAVGEM